MKATDEERYQLYVGFCLRALIPPVTFDRWTCINATSWSSGDRNITDKRADRKI